MAGNSTSLVQATAIGTVVQIGMVVAGHYVPAIANGFAIGGVAISLAAGALYAWWASAQARGQAALGGAIAGGLCALIGIAVSLALGDVTAIILLFGTLSSAVTGAIGGLITGAMTGKQPLRS